MCEQAVAAIRYDTGKILLIRNIVRKVPTVTVEVCVCVCVCVCEGGGPLKQNRFSSAFLKERNSRIYSYNSLEHFLMGKCGESHGHFYERLYGSFRKLVDCNENHCESYVMVLRMHTNYLPSKTTFLPHTG